MARQIFGYHLNLGPGTTLRVVGDILPNCSRFGIEMGSDERNAGLHFNLRFNFGYDRNVIVLNSKHENVYGREEKDKHFPFSLGSRTEIFIEFEGQYFVVKLPDGYRITFPNRLDTTKINYVTVFGDFVTKIFAFE